MAESFLTPQEMAELHAIFDDGMKTVEQFQRPAPIIQFRRFNETLGRYQNVGTPVTVIAIQFGLREGQVTQVEQMRQDYNDGDLVMWADSAVIPVPSDRFSWQGKIVEVERVYPVTQSIIRAEIRIQQVTP